MIQEWINSNSKLKTQLTNILDTNIMNESIVRLSKTTNNIDKVSH